MAQIRECVRCKRRIYSSAWKTTQCSVRACQGRMLLVIEKDRPRNRFKLDGTKLGEFW